MLPPNNVEDALQLIRDMEDHYKLAFKGFEEDEQWYEGQLEDFISVPEGFNVVIPTTARAVVDEAVDNASPQDLIITYPPRGRDKKAEEDADAVRVWAKHLWRYWRTHASDIDPVRDFQKNLFTSGKAVFKLSIDEHLWPTLSRAERRRLKHKKNGALDKRTKLIEDVRRHNTPLVLRSLPPSCVMEDPTVGGRKLWIIERYEGDIAEVRNTYSLYEEDLRRFEMGSDTGVRVHELWTATYVRPDGTVYQGKHMVFINEDLVHTEDNPTLGLPYFVRHSGYGRETYDGRPELKSVGFFTRQNKSMFLAQARAFTNMDAIMSQLAFPIGFLPEAAELSDISFAPGAVNFVDDNTMERIDRLWVKPSIPDREYSQLISMIGAQIERGTVQSTLRGAGVPGTDSAAQYGLINQQAKLRIDAVSRATEAVMSAVTETALEMVDRQLEDDVSVLAAEDRTERYTLGPKQIRGRYVVDVQFQPNEESLKERKLVLAADAMTKGVMSPYDALIYAGFDNAGEMLAKKYAYDIMQEPVIKQYLAERALDEYGFNHDQVEFAQRTKDAQKQVVLREMMNMLQAGTLGEIGEPGSPGGVPQPQPQFAPAGGPPGVGMPMPGGAPPGAQAAPVAGMMQDINSLRSAPMAA